MINKPPIHISTLPNHYATNLQFTYASSFPPTILRPLPTQKKNQSKENQTNKQKLPVTSEQSGILYLSYSS